MTMQSGFETIGKRNPNRTVPDYLKRTFEKRAEGIYCKYASDESLLHKAAKSMCRYKR